jgi:hypothetical protein
MYLSMYASIHRVCVGEREREYMEGRHRETERVYSWKVSNKVNISVNTCKVFPLVHFVNANFQRQIYVPCITYIK